MLLLQVTNAQQKFGKLDNWLNNNLKDLGGRAVLVIFKDGKIIYNHAENEISGKQKIVGKFLAKKQGRNPDDALQNFSSTTKERIASSSKWLSAALVMTFVDEGKLSLDDTIGMYLPEMTANGKGQIKVWHCLSHLTGIKTGSLRESLQSMKKVKSMDEAIALLAKMPMEGEPGKTFHYSNAGLQIAGAIIEKISGERFEKLFEEKIAKPCKMFETDFGHTAVPLPAGGGWSTAEDYTRFLTMILNEGFYEGTKVLSKESIAAMQKNRIDKTVTISYSPAEAGNWGYGFGEWILDDTLSDNKSNIVSSPGLFGSFPWIDNSKNYTGFLMTFNLKSKGRNERYTELKKLTEEIIE